MEELKKFQSSTFDTIARRRSVEDQDTILELTGKMQEFEIQTDIMNDSQDFQDAESVRIRNSHVTSLPVPLSPHPNSWRNGQVFWRNAEPQRRAAKHLGHGISGNVFENTDASSSAPYPQELNQWNSSIEEKLDSSTVEKSERQTQDQYQRCQSGPWAKNSVINSGGDSKNYGADQQRLQISDLQFYNFFAPATFACWKIRFKTEVCICSQFPTDAMHWINEVELVDSLDKLRSSSSTRGISTPKFEVLDARIASALNKIVHNSHSQMKNQSGRTEGPEAGPFRSRQTDCLLDLRLLVGLQDRRVFFIIFFILFFTYSKWNPDSRTRRWEQQWHLSSASVLFGWWSIRATWGNPDRTGQLEKFWDCGVAARIQGKFGGWWNSGTWRLSRQFFPWSFFRAHSQETWGFV